MTYFQRNSQRTPQWNPRRRNGHTDSGVIVVHTFEAPAGRTCTWGANFLRTRTDYGSYHWLADALGYTLHLAPWSAETWHETTVNNWAVGISMMAYAANWRKITPTQRRNLIRGAALGAHRYSRWRVSQGKSAVPARRISRAQALARVPGFIGHGEIDTKRRTDPGRDFPWDEFLAVYASLEAGGDKTTPPPIVGRSARPDVEVQLALAVLGFYDPGPNLQYLDGINGDHQKAAVQKYQRSHGLHEDGWWGTNTNKHFEENDMSTVKEELATAVWGWIHGSEDYNMGFLLRRTFHQQAAVLGNQAGLLKAIEQLSTGGPIDLEAIKTAAEKGVADALAGLEADVTLNINTTQED